MVAQHASRNQFVGYDGQTYNNDVLNQFGTYQCIAFRDRILNKYSDLGPALRAEYHHLASKESHVKANLRFLDLDQSLHVRNFNYLSGLDGVKALSIDLAEQCTKIKANHTDEESYLNCTALAQSYEIAPPNPEDYKGQVSPCVNRLCCDKWWRRQLRKKQRATIEAVARDLRQIHNHRASYCSDLTLKLHRQQKQNNRDFLESKVAINELGFERTLAELSSKSVSNPTIRRIELIVRCKGFEVIANEYGHKGVFLTLTTPSRFHRMTKITNKGKVIKVIPNKNYENLSPRDAQDYLRNVWARIQAKLSRENIRPYGFRVAEPHHDATPHWHFLLFISADQLDRLADIFRCWALKDSPNENGAKKHRLKIEHIKTGINPKTGTAYSATGYLIKYICKNIDGYGIDNDEASANGCDWEGKNPQEVAERIEAWARTNRIRQFQQIGGPSVTVWRELRRISEQDNVLEDIRKAADAGDWAAFIRAMGGPNIKRNEQSVRPAYALPENLDVTTGELSKITHTEYGDEARERVIGVLLAGVTILSRTHYWTIKDNEKVNSARLQIMKGIADILEEIREQNSLCTLTTEFILSQQAKPAALDSCQ